MKCNKQIPLPGSWAVGEGEKCTNWICQQKKKTAKLIWIWKWLPGNRLHVFISSIYFELFCFYFLETILNRKLCIRILKHLCNKHVHLSVHFPSKNSITHTYDIGNFEKKKTDVTGWIIIAYAILLNQYDLSKFEWKSVKHHEDEIHKNLDENLFVDLLNEWRIIASVWLHLLLQKCLMILFIVPIVYFDETW